MLFTDMMKENKRFLKAYKKGGFVSDKAVTAYFVPNKTPYNCLGITVSKKVGNAVKRNRAKRIIKAAYRNCETEFPIGYDMIFVAREGITNSKSSDLERFIRKRLLKSINKSVLKKGVRQ